MRVSKLQYDVKRTRLGLTATPFLLETKENNRPLLIRKGFKQYTFCPKHLIMGNKIKQLHYNRELPTCKIITLPLCQESTCTLAPQSPFDKHNRKQ